MAIAPAAQRKILDAAAQVETSNRRSSAILGGIVRSVIDYGHLDGDFIARYTHDVIGYFGLANVDRRPPGRAEIAMVKSLLEVYYGRRLS